MCSVERKITSEILLTSWYSSKQRIVRRGTHHACTEMLFRTDEASINTAPLVAKVNGILISLINTVYSTPNGVEWTLAPQLMYTRH